MNLIKLSAISSTNDYLKELAVEQMLKDFTVVWAAHQTDGKGQMGSKWEVESSKNLTFSVLLNGSYLKIENIFTINVMIANSIHSALSHFSLENIMIKWPNDILSYNKKIAGVLIENTFKSDGEMQSVVGIGINVSQTNFTHIPQASSLLNQYGIELDKEELLTKIVEEIELRMSAFDQMAENEWDYYHKYLFRKNKVSSFEAPNGKSFNGIIQKVTRQGQLVILNETDRLETYHLKEIKLLY